MTHDLTEQRWQAIITNDKNFDDSFFYAVKSTKIFCRPSCRSRKPRKDNVAIFFTPEEATKHHYRPCKRCRPTGDFVPDDEWVVQIKQYLNEHYQEHITLDKIADDCHGSPYHLHHVFKRVTGQTPLDYLVKIRMEQAKNLLCTTDLAISKVGKKVGLDRPTYFSTLFKKYTGVTPTIYKKTCGELRL